MSDNWLITLGVHAMRAITMHLLFEPVNNTVRSLVELLPQEDNVTIPKKHEVVILCE